MQVLTDSKTEKIARIIQSNYTGKINNMLVVGCGSGIEAAIMAQQLGIEVTGLDKKDCFDAESSKIANLKIGDATSLEFENESFDYVYCYHALEHIQDPIKALNEMKRVLKKGGGFWIGTPNKFRILGYLGSKTATLDQKIRWNINDWKARLNFSFTNELGAHAGFSSWELCDLLKEVFPTVNDKTKIYYSNIYEKNHLLLQIINFTKCSTFLYTSIYFMGVR